MKSLVLLSFSLTLLTQGFADGSLAAEPNEQVSVEEQSQVFMQSEDTPEWCLSPYHEFHASVRHNEANGIGYKEGYTTLEVFGIFDGYGSGFMPFFDVRGHVFNDGKLAGNLGIGERTLLTSIDHTFGSYLYYDVRRVGHGLTVNQLSPGIELVGERMEYRINGYFPLGKQKGRKYGFEFDEFKGHSIILKAKQQQAMMGGDAEVGIHIPQNTTYDIYAAAGPYYFHSSNASAWGGKARLLGRYKEYVTLEVAYSYDHLFRNVVQGSIAFTVPFGGKLQRCGKCCPQDDNLLLSRAAFAPSRFEIPVVKRVHRKQKAINPATGEPWVVWFVNNTSSSAGTFESPFPTLLAAQNASSPNEMIYVFAGNGTTSGMNAGITLKNGQTFFGSGISQQFATTKGTQTIPMFSATNPSITNTAGDVVTLRNGNVVSGFSITINPANNGIVSAGSINGATIINNIVNIIPPSGNGNGITITGSGTVNISNNRVNDLSGFGGTAIAVVSTGGKMSGVINNNSISGFFNGIDISPTTLGYDFTIAGNTITNFRSYGFLSDLLSQATVNLIGNTINTNANGALNGINIDLDGGGSPSLSSLIDSNNIVMNSATATNGIFIGTSSSNVAISNNSVQSTKGAGFTGINITPAAGGTICLDLDMNTVVTVPGATAYGFTATAGILNIESITGNLGGPISSTGTVNLVAPGTCGN